MHTSFSELSPAPSPLFVSEFFTCPLHEHRHAASSRPVRWELLPSLHPGSCPLSAEPCGRLCHPQRLSPGAMSGPGHREGTRLHCGLAVCGEETLILVTMLVPSVSTQRSKWVVSASAPISLLPSGLCLSPCDPQTPKPTPLSPFSSLPVSAWTGTPPPLAWSFWSDFMLFWPLGDYYLCECVTIFPTVSSRTPPLLS